MNLEMNNVKKNISELSLTLQNLGFSIVKK